MRITIKMSMGFGSTQEEVDFEHEVDDNWEYNEVNVAALYEEFRNELILDVEDIECTECGYTLGQCECDDDDEDE